MRLLLVGVLLFAGIPAWGQRAIPSWDLLCGFDYSPEKHAERLRQLELLKAALLYRCLELIEWPGGSTAREEITVGLLGSSGFSEAARSIAGRRVGRGILRVKELQDVEEAAGCQIVFIGLSEKRRVGAILERLAALPVLTVGETPRFAQRGGMLSLQINGAKVELEVNPTAARTARIQMDAKLLKLAKAVVSVD